MGPRTWAIAAIVAFSVADPGLVTQWGVYVGIAVWLTGSPLQFRTDRVFWALAMMFGWMWLSTTWAINPEAGGIFITALVTAMTFLLARDAIRSREQLRFVAYAYVIAAAVGVLRLFFGDYVPDPQTGRYTLEGLNANYLGYAICGALAVVVLLWPGARRAGRAALLGSALLVVLGLALTDTRGAAVGAVCLALWIILTLFFRRPPIALLVILLTAASLVITTGLFDTWIRALDFGGRATGDLSGRLVLWPVARELWAQDLLFGLGPQAVRSTTQWGDAHSVFLELGSSGGIVSVVLFVAFLVVTLGYGSRGAESRYRAFAIGAFLAASAPAYLSGAWETAPAAWMLLLVFGRIGAPEALTESRKHGRQFGRRESSPLLSESRL